MATGERKAEAARLEDLWATEFGDAYSERNREAGAGRDAFWRELLAKYPVETALEVGCNVGANLRWLAGPLAFRNVYGIDVNEGALAELRRRLPSVNAVWSTARDLPFRDRRFDLVFTAGVLIHQPEDTLALVMAEVVRCARRYVLALEYFAETPTEVEYRGASGALFKRDYGSLYRALFPELTLRDTGFLTRDAGWDDVTWWLFERP